MAALARVLAPLIISLCGSCLFAAQETAGPERIAVLPRAGELAEARLEFVAPGWLEPEEHAGVADLAVTLLNRAAVQPSGGRLRVGRDERTLWFELSAPELADGLARAGALRSMRAFPAEQLAAAREELAALFALRAADASEPEEDVLELLTGSAAPRARPASLATLDEKVLARFLDQALAAPRLWAAVASDLPAEQVRELVAAKVCAPQHADVGGAAALAESEPGLRGRVLDLPGATRFDLRFSLEARPRHAQYAELLLLADLFAADSRRNPDGRWNVVTTPHAGPEGTPLYLYCSVRADAGKEAVAAALRSGLALLDRLGELSDADFERVRARRLAAERQRAEVPQVRLTRALEDARAPGALAAWERVIERLSEIERADLEQRVESLPAAPLLFVATGPASVLQPLLAEHMPVEVRATRHVAAAEEPGTPAGRAEVERLLAAVGGRERWKSLNTLRTRSAAELAEVQGVLTLVTTVDLERNWLRVDNVAPAQMSWIVRPDVGWLLQADTTRDLSPAEAGRLRERQTRSLYSVLHALALGRTPPPRLGPEGRLELADATGVWVWLRLDETGLPKRLGYQLPGETLETVYDYSEWAETGGYRYPLRTHQLERGNEYETQAFEPNPELAGSLFARP